jgi:hypothetical protein
MPVNWDDETLMAFADGELPPDRAAEVAAAVAADPVLGVRVERFRAVRGRLDDLPLGAPDAAALLARARGAVAARAARRLPAWALAAAAGLAGVAVGLGLMQPRLAADPLGAEMVAHGPLEAALSGEPSGGTVTRGRTRVTPLYTLAAADGRICRAFRTERGAGVYEGAACREGDAWRLLVLVQAPRPAGGFAQASSPEPPAMTAALDALHPGDPLTSAAEAALMRRGWRRE